MNFKIKPSSVEIKNYVVKFNQENYYDEQNYLAALRLAKCFPSNDGDYQSIFIKVNFINGAFKTAIGDTTGVAKQIFRLKDIDERLRTGKDELVADIARYAKVKDGKFINNYSLMLRNITACHSEP